MNSTGKGGWWTRFAAASAGGVAIVAGVFCLVLCALLAVNAVRLLSCDPLDHPGLAALRESFAAAPADGEIERRIRELDLAVRREFLVRNARARAGAGLLAGGAVVLLAALALRETLHARPPLPSSDPESQRLWRAAVLARRAVAAGGATLLLLALTAGIMSRTALDGPRRIAAALPEPEAVERAPVAPRPTGREQNWPAFRGPYGDGIAFVTNVPVAFNVAQGSGMLWQASVPLPGYSSPVVWDQRLFLTGATEDSREVYAYDTDDGSLLWRGVVPPLPGSPAGPPDVDNERMFASSTPVTDGRRVYAVFATGDVVCHDVHGNLVWGRNVGPPEIIYGYASSPCLHSDLLILQLDDEVNPRLLALRTASGETAWETPRESASWSSPLSLRTGPQLVLTSTSSVGGYDPVSGKRLWQVDGALGGEVGASAAYANGMVFVSSEQEGVLGYRVDGQPQQAWAWDDYPANMASPVAAEGCLFLLSDDGTASCLDAQTGAAQWTHDFDNGFYAAPVVAAGRVYALDMGGTLHVFRAARQYEPLGESSLPGENEMVAVPAFGEGRLYLRGEKTLYAIGE